MAKAKEKPKKESKALVPWKEQAKADAAKAADMEKGSGGGKFFSTRAGQLSYDDVTMPGNMMACVVVESMFENVYYAGKFDPDARTPPTCFAFGYDIDEMEPHESMEDHPDTFEKQADKCAECPMNEWGSADTGKGKACGNRRRLAIIPAGQYISKGKNKGYELELFDDEAVFAKADLAYMKLPVTSVKNYSKYVRSLNDQLGLPPYAVFTNVEVVPDEKSQFKVDFELLEEIPDELMNAVFAKHQEAEKEITFPYQPRSDDEEEAKPARKSSSAKKLKGGAKKKGRQRKE